MGGNCYRGNNPIICPHNLFWMACHAMSGRIEEAREICARMMQLKPALRISRIKDRTPFRRAEDIERLAQAFRIAGMPE